MRLVIPVLSAALTLGLAACEGPQGPPGPAGGQGPTGQPGQDGQDGDDGDPGQDGEDGEDGRDWLAGIFLSPVGTYGGTAFDEGQAEIVAWDGMNSQIFVVNAAAGTVDVLDASDPTALALVDTLTATDNAGTLTLDEVNSVAVNGDLLAVAVAGPEVDDPGAVQFYRTDTLAFLGQAEICSLPDMVAFTPDGTTALAACEGEPSDDYSVDPDGGVAIIDISGGAETPVVTIADFTGFDADKAALAESGVRFNPAASVSDDLEPEYIAVSDDGATAWVTLQENNAVAVVDVAGGTISAVLGLGAKDHGIPGNELDASDRDDRVNIRSWPVFGLYMPDTIVQYEVNGTPYLITANEGDAREYETYVDEARVEDLMLDPLAFPDYPLLQTDAQLGRLTVSTIDGDTDGDGDYDELYAFGARSFSIWNGLTGQLVYDSGHDFEVITARRYGFDFNNNNDENEGDTRSDAKGPEPEALAVGQVGPNWYAFIGLERMGGIMVYDVSHPESPRFVQYALDRDFTATGFDIGDLGPEGMAFVPADDSPTGTLWLIVGNEVSGTTTVYEISPYAAE